MGHYTHDHMGHYIHDQEQQETVFKILSKNVLSALKSLKAISKLSDETASNDFNEILRPWGWEVENDNNGNVVDIFFIGKKEGRDEELFAAIAPFVEDGSYVEMCGEHNNLWRWTFEGGCMKEKYPTIIWK